MESIDDLSEKHTVVVGFQTLDYGKTLKQFQKVQKPDNFIIPVGLLSISDIIKVFINYIKTAKIYMNNDYLFKGKETKPLINNALQMDYFKLWSFQAYLELAIAMKLKYFNPNIFLYIFNQGILTSEVDQIQ